MIAATGLPARLQPRVLAAPTVLGVVLALAHLLPVTGIGAAIRLAAAGLVVLVLPGALILRTLRWPESIGVAAAASVLLSLAVAGVALAAAFLFDRSLDFGLVVGGVVTLAALALAALGQPVRLDRPDVLAGLGLAVGVVPVATVFWWFQTTVNGDALFHLGRIVKLEELPTLTSLTSVGEFRNGGLHPGYAFPLWHGVVAAIARLGGVSGETAVLHVGQALAPLTVLVAYGAGRALFSSWAGGVAAAAAQTAIWCFQGSSGALRTLSDPETAARSLVAPALLAVVFVYLDEGDNRLLVPVTAGGLAVAVMHPNYPLYLLIVLAGFLLAGLLVTRELIAGRRLAVVGAAIAIPTAAVVLALWPVITDSVHGARAGPAGELGYYAGDFVGTSGSFHQAPGAITRAGGVAVAGLLSLPLAALCARRRWGAFAAGGSLVLLAIVLTPVLFTQFADATSLAQARRLVGFLPLAAAIAGTAVVLARFRALAVVGAAAAGLALVLAYPGEWTFFVVHPGPAWPVWVAVGGALAGLALAIWRWPWPEPPSPTPWAAAIGVALVLPFVVSPLLRLQHGDRERLQLSPGLVAELRKLPPRETVFADPAVSYRILATAPLYTASAPLVHVAETKKNRAVERLRDANRFFSRKTSPAARREILSRYAAEWLVVDREREALGAVGGTLGCVFSDGRFDLYRVGAASGGPTTVPARGCS